MQVETVLGPVDPSALGVTLPHEHLIIDATCLWHDPAGESWVGPLLAGSPGGPSLEELAQGPVVMEHLGELLRTPHVSRDNLQVTDIATLVDEARRFSAAGGRTIVDLTNRGLGRDPRGLQQVARETGLHVVMGCGYYVEAGHPADLRERAESEIAESMVRDIQEGVDGSGIRAGIIGEIGTGNPMKPAEARVLRAAARAQLETGVALNIHVSTQAGPAALDLVLAAGVDPRRVVVSHVDTFSNLPYALEIAERGAFVEFDNFGANWWFSTRALSDDGTRVTDLLRLVERGYLQQLLLSQDVGTKIQLVRYGGFGYAYLSRYVEPMLRARGLSADEIATLRVGNPLRMLAGPD